MELRSKRKSHAFRFRKSSKQTSSLDYIHHQTTLIGSFLTLMETQMSLIAVLRRKSEKGDSLFPFGFKVEKNQVPSDWIPLEINAKNLISVTIPECGSFPAMIVAVGSDSKELFESYKNFYGNAKKKSVNNLEKKITCWINTEGIEIQKINSKGLPSIEEDKFREILYKCKIQESKGEGTKVVNQDVPVPGTSSSFMNISSNKNPENLRAKNREEEGNIISSVNRSLKNIREMNEDVMTPQMVKAAFSEVVKVLEAILLSTHCNDITKPVKPQSGKRINFSQTREIVEKNPTYEVGNITMVEGVLPLFTKDYKRAISMGNPKNPRLSFKPTTTITNIVKFAFPKHWLSGVTLRGAGGNRSLTSIWSYPNPLLDPCEGEIEEDLGEFRLQALFDHAVRKSKKLSYDKAMEENMINALSKALHYFKSKLGPVKTQRVIKSKKDDFSSIYGSFESSRDESLDSSKTIPKKIIVPTETISDEEDESQSKKFNFSNLAESDESGEDSAGGSADDSAGENSAKEDQTQQSKGNTLKNLLEPLDLDPYGSDADDSTGLNKILAENPTDSSINIENIPMGETQKAAEVEPVINFRINDAPLDNPDTSTSISEIRNISDVRISTSESENSRRSSCGTIIERVDDDSGIHQSFGQVLQSTPLKRVSQDHNEKLFKRFKNLKTPFSNIAEKYRKEKEKEKEEQEKGETEKEGEEEEKEDKREEGKQQKEQDDEQQKEESQDFQAEKFPMLKESDLAILKNLSDPKFAYQLAKSMAEKVVTKV